VVDREGADYYTSRTEALVKGLQESTEAWCLILSRNLGRDIAERVIAETISQFRLLIPKIPYIGGDENHLTGSLVNSVECLAFYKAMSLQEKTAAEAGKVLYDAVVMHHKSPGERVAPVRATDRENRIALRRTRAEQSQEREYPLGYVYTFIEGQSGEFDYGYDFLECATEKFYRHQDALGFLPFFCFLDFPKCMMGGLGLTRTQTLGEGGDRCDFRFMEGGQAAQAWPPPFLEESLKGTSSAPE
jgi:hypothetical protein